MNEITKVKINFNEPHITYKNSKEQKIVGVTTALKVLAIPALTGWAYNKGRNGENLYEQGESANAGTITHARILGYFLGYEIDQYNISQEVWDWTENSMTSFYQHIKGKKIEPIILETPLISEKYQYGGTLDLFARVDSVLELWDFKTGTGIYETNIYQLAALRNLVIENGYESPERVIPINVPKSPDSSYATQDHDATNLDDEFQIFLNCVDTYYRQRNIKAKKKGKK